MQKMRIQSSKNSGLLIHVQNKVIETEVGGFLSVWLDGAIGLNLGDSCICTCFGICVFVCICICICVFYLYLCVCVGLVGLLG